MSLKRETLKAMGLNEEQITSIIEGHTETVDGLKEQIKALKEKYADYDTIKKERDDLKGGKDYKAEAEKIKGEFESYKKSVTEKETAAAKDKAGRAFFESKGITGANLELAMRAARSEISACELDGEKFKDTKELDALVAGDLKGLVVTKGAKGADKVDPPAGGGSVLKTKAEIYAKDEHGRYKLDSTERQRELAKIAQAEQD